MNLSDLNKVALAMVAPGKGLLAADESTGTIKKRFDAIKVESTEDTGATIARCCFRSKDAMSKCISGVILYDETIRQNAKDGTPLVKLIEQAGAIPGIKVDEGTQALPACPGELVTVGLDKLADDGLRIITSSARAFAKWRAVIDIGKDIPSMTAIHVNAHALARYAALCQQAQIVPIVEPEVLDGWRSRYRPLLRRHPARAQQGVSGIADPACRARRHDPQAQHGDLGQEMPEAGAGRGGRGEDRARC